MPTTILNTEHDVTPSQVRALWHISLERNERLWIGILSAGVNTKAVLSDAIKDNSDLVDANAGNYFDTDKSAGMEAAGSLNAAGILSRRTTKFVNKKTVPTAGGGTAVRQISATAYRTQPDTNADLLFFVRETAAAGEENEMVLVNTGPMIFGSGLDWHFIPYRHKETEHESLIVANPGTDANMYGILVNGQSPVLGIYRRRYGCDTPDDSDVGIDVFPFFPNDCILQPPGTNPRTGVGNVQPDPTDDVHINEFATFAITAVRRIEFYNGSIVYGGFQAHVTKKFLEGVGNNGRGDYSHWIAFSSPYGSTDAASKLVAAFDVSATTAMPIGDGPHEPITGVATITTDTDQMGSKGQLAIWTPEKMVIFDGLPPIPEIITEEEGVSQSDFRSIAMPGTGCWGGRSIVKTPYGVVFLGSDGMVYIMSPDFPRPRPIGRAIEPETSKLTPSQMTNVAAYYLDGWYKMSIPDPNTSFQTHNSRQWWADLRGFGKLENDFGVRWFGPMTDVFHASYAKSFNPRDNQQVVLAGSSVGGRLFQVEMNSKKTHPLVTDGPQPPEAVSDNKADGVAIKCRAISGIQDFGDAHEDIEVVAVELGVGTDIKTDIEINVAAASVDTGSGEVTRAAEFFTEEVEPSLGKAGFKLGTDGLPVKGGYELVTKKPECRLVGRATTIEFREKPNADADKDPKVVFGDFAVRFKKKPRRG